MKKTLLTLLAFSTMTFADFTRNLNIVTDNTTGLMWQDDSVVASTYTTWQGAIDYCEALELSGYTDWRLPNINELRSIVDISREDGEPTISIVFQNTYHKINYSVSNYWSSTTKSNLTDVAFRVNFASIGFVTLALKNNNYTSSINPGENRVRCVRAGE